jgi:hypothetical protein
MNQKEFGRAYYTMLSAMKDSVAMELGLELTRAGISKDVAQRMIATAQSSIDRIGGNAFDSLNKSL